MHRPGWKSEVEQRSPAVKAYVEHLHRISSSDPTRLIAHAYTQHLALLAGGQRIRKFVSSTVPGLQKEDGVRVFSFEVMCCHACMGTIITRCAPCSC